MSRSRAALALLLLAPLLLVQQAVSAPAHAATAVSQATSRCPASVARQFRPRYIAATGVRRPVIAPRRVNGVPGTPPISTAGKAMWAWDRYFVWPGAPRGTVLLNAHTWPDGTALGNRLLARLKLGGRIVVTGTSTQKLCYRVTKRIEVMAGNMPKGLYSARSRPQLIIVVCSGRRLGPGHWEKRTIWYASPSA